MTEIDKSPQERVIVRRPDDRDVEALVRLCARSFRTSVRWQGARWHAARWWAQTIASSACESWLCDEGGSVAAACVLVIDEQGWASERKARCGPLVDYLTVLACRPNLILSEVMDRAAFLCSRFVCSRCLQPIERRAGRRGWLELIAVDPDRRGRGLARQLLAHCRCRCLALDREWIELLVARRNAPARALYESFGFSCVDLEAVRLKYSLRLDREAAPGG